MTMSAQISREPLALVGDRSIEVRWSAIRALGGDRLAPAGPRGLRRHELILVLRLVDPEHGLLDAWVEGPAGTRLLRLREAVACRVALDHGLIHVDAERDGRRILALSLATSEPPARILYARSPLLEEAGFVPGAYDPPTARLRSPDRDAASASA